MQPDVVVSGLPVSDQGTVDFASVWPGVPSGTSFFSSARPRAVRCT